MNECAQPPATSEEIDVAATQLKARFQAVLPLEYHVFLLQTNGLDHNSLVLYGAGQSPDKTGPGDFWQGLVATNILWRDGLPKDDTGRYNYLVLGETSMDLLTVDLDGNMIVLRDKVSNDVNEQFKSVAEAIQTLIRRYQ